MGRLRRTLTSAIYISGLLAAVVLWLNPVLASTAPTNYSVKAGGGGNFTTIQACATAMAAGDTCTVYAGTYNENVTVSAGGVGTYKTLTVNPGDTVYVLSFSINSHVKINGFHIQNPSSPTANPCVSVAANSTDIYVTNNNMYACNEAYKEPQSSSNVTHRFIQGNTISYMCSTSSAPNVCLTAETNGDYLLWENNDISHVSDGPYLHGRYIIYRKNTFHDVNSSDCGSNSSNCHIDFMQADASSPPSGPTEYLVIEANTTLNMPGGNMHGVGLFQGAACSGQCYNGIVRFHMAAHVGESAIVDNDGAWPNVKAYNNTWVDIGSATGSGGMPNNFTSSGAADINDIFYYPWSPTNWNPYGCEGSACSTFSYGHNLAYCTTNCLSQLHSHVYGTGNWADDPTDVYADPQFLSFAGNDFHLLATSAALGAGTNLTTSTNSGSTSTTLTVSDAGYFQDGFGIPGVQPDCLRLGASTVTCIASGGVNYSTNTITLAAPATWSNGAAVYLYSDSAGTVRLTGSSPNIGAFGLAASGTSLAPPTQLAVVSVN